MLMQAGNTPIKYRSRRLRNRPNLSYWDTQPLHANACLLMRRLKIGRRLCNRPVLHGAPDDREDRDEELLAEGKDLRRKRRP